MSTRLDAEAIRKHLKDCYGFKDEYSLRYKKEQRLIRYVYRLSHPAIKEYVHILREEPDHILSLDIIYKDTLEKAIGANNIKVTRNSNFAEYSYSSEYPEYNKIGGRKSPPAARCNVESSAQLDYLASALFGLKPIR